MALTTKHLTDRIATALAFLADNGFRYFRSFHHFRRSDPAGYSYIRISSVTHNRTVYHLAFHVGVRIDALEATVREILQQPTELTHHDRSVLNYTVNIGPESPNWNYPIRGLWTFQSDRDIDEQLPEITNFVRDLVLPFLDRNTTSAAIRETLLDFPRHTINLKPFQQILGADVLTSDVAQLDADYFTLCQRYPQWHPQLKAEFNDFYMRAKAFLQTHNA
jgi:hypothetical protein